MSVDSLWSGSGQAERAQALTVRPARSPEAPSVAGASLEQSRAGGGERPLLEDGGLSWAGQGFVPGPSAGIAGT